MTITTITDIQQVGDYSQENHVVLMIHETPDKVNIPLIEVTIQGNTIEQTMAALAKVKECDEAFLYWPYPNTNPRDILSNKTTIQVNGFDVSEDENELQQVLSVSINNTAINGLIEILDKYRKT